jgi:hypothetical protein
VPMHESNTARCGKVMEDAGIELDR